MSATLTTRTRYVLTGVLRARTGVHVGAGAGVPGVDLVVQTDGLRRPVITGTSLAGVLRSVVGRALPSGGPDGEVAGKDAIAVLLGDTDRASRVVVDDAPMTTGRMRHVRDGVGIARHTGVADPGVLYSREVVVPGACFEFRMEVLAPEVPGGGEEPPPGSGRWLALTCARALVSGVRVGAGTTRGLGLLVLEGAELTVTGDLGTPAGVLDALSGTTHRVEIGEVTAPPGVLRVTVGWAPRGTLMCGVAVDGAVDAIPQTTPVHAGRTGGPEVRLLLPGSGIKGALRARAEVITRTVLSTDPTRPVRSPETVLDACADEDLPDVRALFGAPAYTEEPDPVTRVRRQRGRRGALGVDDVLSTSVISGPRWATLLTALATLPSGADEDERKAKQRLAFRGAVNELNDEVRGSGLEFAVVDHVAVDRWTGGAASNRLFAVAEPTSCAWEPITLDLDLTRLPEGGARGPVALLLLVLRDLAEGWVPLGKGTRRGWGDVAVTSIRIEAGEGSGWKWLRGDLLQPIEGQPDHLNELIEEWFTNVEAAGRARVRREAAS